MGVSGLNIAINSAPGATRTRNQLIRSQVLYPLSYGGERGNYTANFWQRPICYRHPCLLALPLISVVFKQKAVEGIGTTDAS